MRCIVMGAFIAIESRKFGDKTYNDLKLLIGSDTQAIGIPDEVFPKVPQIPLYQKVTAVIDVKAYNSKKSNSAVLGLSLEEIIIDPEPKKTGTAK